MARMAAELKGPAPINSKLAPLILDVELLFDARERDFELVANGWIDRVFIVDEGKVSVAHVNASYQTDDR
jgi:hypothetical protein